LYEIFNIECTGWNAIDINQREKNFSTFRPFFNHTHSILSVLYVDDGNDDEWVSEWWEAEKENKMSKLE
jgi:hypothetical protein